MPVPRRFDFNRHMRNLNDLEMNRDRDYENLIALDENVVNPVPKKCLDRLPK